MGKKHRRSSKLLNLLLAGFLIFGSTHFTYGSASDVAHGDEKAPFDAGEMILHHIADANEFHVVGNISIPLPVMIYNRDTKNWFFGMSNSFHAHHGNGTTSVDGYVMQHSRIFPEKNVVNATELSKLELEVSTLEKQKGNSDEEEIIKSQIAIAESKIDELSDKYIDFSITKNVFTLILSVILLLLIFTSIAKAYKRREGQAPKGLQSFIEPVIVFVRDEIAKPSIGEHKYMKFMPYLLTIFFFIWLNNIMGLIPFFPGGLQSNREYCYSFGNGCFHTSDHYCEWEQKLLAAYFCNARSTQMGLPKIKNPAKSRFNNFEDLLCFLPKF